MSTSSPVVKDTLRIREMTIDDFSAVFHIGEEVFTAESFQSLYRTWDEYEITTFFNSDSELCLVAEAMGKILGFVLGTTVKKHNSPWKYGYLVWLGVRRDIQQGGVGSGGSPWDSARRLEKHIGRKLMGGARARGGWRAAGGGCRRRRRRPDM